nr:TetR/AcrR family transcriptional regulator [uncultured Roseateles sp.]
MKPALSPRKSPRQSRSQATVNTILDATARVLVERGYAATSTNAVAERAGVSVGSLYQYFPNKDALILALRARHSAQMESVIQRSFEGVTAENLDEALVGVIHTVVEAHRVEADLHQALDQRFGEMNPMSGPSEADRRISELLATALLRYRSEIKVDDIRLAAYVLTHALHAVVHAIVRDRPAGVSLQRATREIVRLARAYLVSPA